MAEWKFEKKLRNQKTRDPMQASFFTNASIDNDTHALVREAIQNSLDAKANKTSPDPVKVRFYIGSHSAESGVMNFYVPDDAWCHFSADDNGLKKPPRKSDDCRFLVYEDFNTTGLIGDERAFEADPGNSFYYFLRAEGQSGKEDGDIGRHGIGKYVFPYTSGIRMFIAATVRSSDDRCLVAGQSVLRSHSVNNERYTPDGWWGTFEGDDCFQLPVEDPKLLKQMEGDFELKRTGHAGLSLVMPYVQASVTVEKITEHVIKEYFFPILKGQLVAEVVEGNDVKIIDAASLQENLGQLVPEGKIPDIAPFVNVAIRSLDTANYQRIQLSLPDKPLLPSWNKDYLNKEVARVINEEMAKADSFICIRCPIFVQPTSTNQSVCSHFDIYLEKDLHDVTRKPLFVREGIRIPEDRVPPIHGYTCIVVVEKGPLATLLGDAENPAHTEWEKNAQKFKDKYKWGPTTIDFVRLSVGKLLKLLSQGDEEEDRNVLSDIFYIDLPEDDSDVPESRKKKEKKKPEGGVNPDLIIDIPRPSPRYYRLSKLLDGFTVKGPVTELQKPRRYTVKVAYDVAGASKAKALKSYHKNDFEFARSQGVDPVKGENLIECEVLGNQIQFIAEDNNFGLEVTGFDKHRDIIVDVISEDILDEAV